MFGGCELSVLGTNEVWNGVFWWTGLGAIAGWYLDF